MDFSFLQSKKTKKLKKNHQSNDLQKLGDFSFIPQKKKFYKIHHFPKSYISLQLINPFLKLKKKKRRLIVNKTKEKKKLTHYSFKETLSYMIFDYAKRKKEKRNVGIHSVS